MAHVIEIESRGRDVIEIGYRGGGVPWGNITGNLQDQADLKACLDDIWKYAKKNRKLAKAAL